MGWIRLLCLMLCSMIWALDDISANTAVTLAPEQSENHLRNSNTLILGIFAYRPIHQMKKHYQPLADYLDSSLGDAYRIELQVLNHLQMQEALQHNQLDFVLTNPSHFLELRSQTSMTGVLATLERNRIGRPASALGGVIIVQDDSAITQLEDLVGRSIAIPGKQFLGGFQSQLYELLQHGIDQQQLSFVEKGTHDQVIEAVLTGEAEFGFVRTGILEDWMLHDLGDVRQLRVIHSQNLTGFPYALSTRLYPEWPLLALPHLESSVIRSVTRALFSLSSDHPAAQASEISGFMPAADYSAVERLARSIQAPPFDVVDPISFHQLWQQHKTWLVTIMALFGALIISLGWIAYQAIRLRQQKSFLKYERKCLEDVIWGADVGTWEWNINTGETRFNEKWAEMMGFSLADLEPVSIQTWINAVHPDDLAISQKALQGCFDGDTFVYECEVRVQHRKGHWIWILDRGRVVEWSDNGKPLKMSGTHLDITQRRKAQEKLSQLAYYDPLTHLPNRVLLTDRLEQAMARSRRNSRIVALVYLDLDGFKAINDTFGHEMGDHLLVAVASRIQMLLRETDTLARIGGDEFVLVLSELDSSDASSAMLERILVAVASPFIIDHETLHVSASMGVVYYPNRDEAADQLMRHADHAMYQAKRLGKNRFAIFNPAADGESVA